MKNNRLPRLFWRNLLNDSSNKTIERAADYYNRNLNEFPNLLKFAGAGYGIYSQRAARALYVIIKENMMLQYIYERQLFKILLNDDDISVCRSILRIYRDFALPKSEKFNIKLLNYSIETFTSQKQSIANKAYSFHIIEKLVLKYPEIKPEIIALFESTNKYQPENIRRIVIKAIDEFQKY